MIRQAYIFKQGIDWRLLTDLLYASMKGEMAWQGAHQTA